MVALIKNLLVSRFIEHELGREMDRASREEIDRYYQSHSAEFVAPAAVRGAMIFLQARSRMTPEKRAELRQQAQRLLDEAREAKGEADFTRLVQRHSEHQATRYRGGDLGWLTRAQGGATLEVAVSEALFALRESDSFAPLLETAQGFYILKLLERKEAQPRPLAEVEELIRHQLRRAHQFQRETEFQARMKQGLDIQINRPLLESISLPVPEQIPPSLPGAAQRIVNR